jgi:glycine/D-amino acid oxidase-like deaminating enzyme
MNLKTGTLFWLTTLHAPPSYPTLQNDATCDVLVIGGGEAGALCSYYLSEHGVDTILVEKRKVGLGSTSGNTGMLQYSNDTLMYQLAETLGVDAAVRFYKLCLKAIDDLELITDSLEDKAEFQRRHSLYFASNAQDVKKLEAEYSLQKQHGFPVEYLTRSQIAERFPFEKDAALYSSADAQFSPYRFAHGIIGNLAKKGVRVFEDTEVVSIHHENGMHVFHTANGSVIRAKKAVFATGYETQDRQTTPGTVIGSSYAIATEPLQAFPGYERRELIWETQRPYLYMRTTADNRILIGGLDETVADGTKRDNQLPHKAEQLRQELGQLFPQLADVKVEFMWTAALFSTSDGLPFIGEHPRHPGCYYALGYGGNGSLYSTIAGGIIKDLILYGQHPDAAMFNPGRMG